MVGTGKWFSRWLCLLDAIFLLAVCAFAGTPARAAQDSGATAKLSVSVVDDSGGDLPAMAVVSLSMPGTKVLQQGNTDAGHYEFDSVAPGRYVIQATAQGYESAKQTITISAPRSSVRILLHRSSDEEIEQAGISGTGDAGGDTFGMTTSAKEQRTILKIAQALRDNKPQRAGLEIQKLYLDNSTDSNLSYLYGEYEREMNDLTKAKYYWKAAVSQDPRNLAALLELGHTALDEGKPAEALPYLKRAAQVNPTSWHPYALIMVAHIRLKDYPLAVEAAERALALGHGQAASVVQPTLASALAAEGNKDQAIKILDEYLKDHPEEVDAQNLLAALRQPPAPASPAPAPLAPAIEYVPLLPSAWMPRGVDDGIPPVEPGVPCSLNTVLNRAKERMTELVADLQRFEATESLRSQRIGDKGVPSRLETRSYRYMVSIEEVRPGILSVSEFRDNKREQADPPEGIVTVGLPALALVFHPAQIGNYNFTCEGLAHTKSGLAWQIYFRQRQDKYPTLHAYTRGDQIYPVGLKGRAWIAADSFQVVRLESDLVKSYPDIRLVAEHTRIEYVPVRFRTKDVRLWLPENAEVYFDWRGKRVHRLLSFSDYSLFSVDASQHIKPPKNAELLPPDKDASAPQKPD